MSDTFCECASARTRKYVADNNNICPVCNKTLIEEPTYEKAVDMPALEREKDSDVSRLLELLGDATLGSTKNRPTESVKLKMPRFSGNEGMEARHFFLKLENYYEAYKIVKEETKTRILKQALDDRALDLYISLDEDTQSDITALEKIFVQHFSPRKHEFLEMKEFFKFEKSSKESVSEFLLRLRKKAKELLVTDDMIRAIFLNGLGQDYQKHIALQKAFSIEETIEAALEYEKITKLSEDLEERRVHTVPVGDKGELQNLKEMMSQVLQRLDKQESRQQLGSKAEKNQQGNELKNAVLNPAAKPFAESWQKPNSRETRSYQRYPNTRHQGQDGNQRYSREPDQWNSRSHERKGNFQNPGWNWNGAQRRGIQRGGYRNNQNRGNNYTNEQQYRGERSNWRKEDQQTTSKSPDGKRWNFSATVTSTEREKLESSKPEQCKILETSIKVDKTSGPRDFGMGEWIWRKNKALLVNKASPDLGLDETGLNGNIAFVAQHYQGIADGHKWKGLKAVEGENLKERLKCGDLAISEFKGGKILHAIYPSSDQIGGQFRDLKEVTNVVKNMVVKILKHAKEEGFYKVWMQCQKEEGNSDDKEFVQSVNLGTRLGIKEFQEKEEGKRLGVIVNTEPQQKQEVGEMKSGLLARSRGDNRDWNDGHVGHKKWAEEKAAKVLIFGDSIVKHMDKSREIAKEAWLKLKIGNCGLSGDRVENIFWRIQNFEIPESVETVIIAGGTNNLLRDSEESILGTIRDCEAYLKSRYPNIIVKVQSILPRSLVDDKIVQKIKSINKKLEQVFKGRYINIHQEMLNAEGRAKRTYFRSDGLHLSGKGNDKLVKKIIQVITEQRNQTMLVDQGEWTYGYAKANMLMTGKIEEERVEVLIDTGSFVTILNNNIFSKLKSAEKITSHLADIRGLGGVSKEIIGATNIRTYFGEHFLDLTCHIVEDMKFDVILGRDTLDKRVHSINIGESTITFKSQQEIDGAELENDISGRLAKHYVLEPHSVTEVEIQGLQENGGCQITGRKELIKQGLLVPQTRRSREKNSTLTCLLHNITPKRIILDKNQEVATVRPITYTSAEVWTVEESADTTEILRHSKALAEEITTKKEITEMIKEKNIGELETPEQREEVRTILMQFKDVFANDEEDLQHMEGFEHQLELTDYTPIRQRSYKTDAKSQEIIDETVEKLLKSGIIEPSNSEWSSPVILVKKKDGGHRMCVDYRKLNKVLRKDEWPLPRIQDILDTLGGSKYYSVLDLKSGFFQIKMAQDAKKFTAFICKRGLFEYGYMPFGLLSNPAAFCRAMRLAFGDMDGKELVFYIDDIICFAPTVNGHNKVLGKFLDRCMKAHLKLNFKKCEILKRKVTFLGHVISAEGIEPNPAKIEVVKNHPMPKTKKQLQSFLGLVNYYRRFIRDVANISAPLNSLLRKNVRFRWTPECERAFRKLIELLVTEPILSFPDFDKEFQLQVDASNTSLGYVLSQEKDGEETAIAFGGRTLNKHEINYSVYEKEGLAVISGIKHFHHYLYGRHFTIWTDNTAVTWLYSQKEPKGKLARWIMSLLEYDFTVKYRKGSLNGNADGISRIPAVATVVDVGLEELVKNQEEDGYLKEVLEKIETREVADKYLRDENKIIWRRTRSINELDDGYRLAVPEKMQGEILKINHDDILAGHGGINKTYGRINRKYHWPNMYKDIVTYCHQCQVCCFKKSGSSRKAPLLPIPVKEPFENVFMDVIGPMPMSDQYSYLIVFVCALTKWVEARPLRSADAKDAAKALFEEVFTRHGSVKNLITDQGSNFTSALFSELCKLLRINKIHTTAFHPEGNGTVERLNGTLIKMLAIFIEKNQKNWVDLLPAILFSYRTGIHRAINMTPFEAIYGRRVLMPQKIEQYAMPKLKQEAEEQVKHYIGKIKLVQEKARENNQKAQERSKKHFDKTAEVTNFRPGDLVLLKVKARIKGRTPKLEDKYFGPFEILAQISAVNYRIKKKDSNKEMTVHVNRMKALTTEQLKNDKQMAELIGGSDEEEFERFTDEEQRGDHNTRAGNDIKPNEDEEILEHRYEKGKLQFLIQNGRQNEAKWTPEKNVQKQKRVEYMKKLNRYETRSKREGDVATIICEVETTQYQKFGAYWAIVLLMVLLGCGLSIARAELPNWGPVYDCDVTIRQGIYALPDELTCKHNFHAAKVDKYKAEVQQYHPGKISVRMYHCHAKEVTKECKENFFAAKDRSRHEKEVLVTKQECMNAVKKKKSKYGRLVKAGVHRWQTDNIKPYRCLWWRDKIVKFTQFTVSQYIGVLKGEDKKIQQMLTATVCFVENQFCIPKEQPSTVLVWIRKSFTRVLYRSLGEMTIHQMGEYIIIAKLGIGGSVIKRLGHDLLLDNTYVIQKRGDLKKPKKRINTFWNFTKNYAKRTKQSVERELFQGQLGELLMKENGLIASMASMLCESNRKLRQMHRVLLQGLPDVMENYIHKERGKILAMVGEAFVVKECQEVRQYVIYWNQEYNGTCYNLPPVKLQNGTLKFLEIVSRRVTQEAHKIECQLRPQELYIKDVYEQFWRYTRQNNFSKMALTTQKYHHGELKLPKLAEFDEKLVHYEKSQPNRMHLLHLVAVQQKNLQDLEDFRTIGEGSIIEGISHGISRVLTTLTRSGIKLVKSIAQGINGVTNETASVVGNVIHGLGHILTFTNGLSGLLLYIIDVLIIGYLVANRVWEHRAQRLRLVRQQRIDQEIRKMNLREQFNETRSPPVPPHGRTGEVIGNI